MKTEITINETEIRKVLQRQWDHVIRLGKSEAPDSMIYVAIETFHSCCSMMRDLTGNNYDVDEDKIIIIE